MTDLVKAIFLWRVAKGSVLALYCWALPSLIKAKAERRGSGGRFTPVCDRLTVVSVAAW